MWLVFLLPINVALLTLDAVVIGICGGGVSATQGVLINRCFGSANFGRALGLMGVAAAPFLLGINMLAGFLHDLTGNYRLPVLMVIACTSMVALMLGVFFARLRFVSAA